MSDDKYIEVPVRVPADLEVCIHTPRSEWQTLQRKGGGRATYHTTSESWYDAVWQQIAAAVEARKPAPPKFQVGDVVEWVTPVGEQRAGVVGDFAFRDGGIIYFLNGVAHYVSEAALTLVRRAEK